MLVRWKVYCLNIEHNYINIVTTWTLPFPYTGKGGQNLITFKKFNKNQENIQDIFNQVHEGYAVKLVNQGKTKEIFNKITDI